jgi:uncharacterized protein (TIGR01440 family)
VKKFGAFIGSVPTVETIKSEFNVILDDLQEQAQLTEGELLIIGCSTSEVVGKKIGTSGTAEVAATIYDTLLQFRKKCSIELAFQCCEHLNRALVVERKTALTRNLQIVSAIPVPTAGGAMAAYAYEHFHDPVLVEHIQADAGIDIGDTLIGMHLKHVAVPVRSKVKSIGHAHVTIAKTRPKLIGGERAVYRETH